MNIRTITTSDGKFLNLDDMKRACQDRQVIEHALQMMVVGHRKKESVQAIMVHVLGSFLVDCAGEYPLSVREPVRKE